MAREFNYVRTRADFGRENVMIVATFPISPRITDWKGEEVAVFPHDRMPSEIKKRMERNADGTPNTVGLQHLAEISAGDRGWYHIDVPILHGQTPLQVLSAIQADYSAVWPQLLARMRELQAQAPGTDFFAIFGTANAT